MKDMADMLSGDEVAVLAVWVEVETAA